MKTEKLEKLVSMAEQGVTALGSKTRAWIAQDARAELTALKAALQNREDILRVFAITAKKEDTVLARQIVAVVDAALLKDAP